MHDAYADILSRITDEPVWYDIHGTPRFDVPHIPLHLMGRIKCQNCRKEFWVSLTDNVYHQAAMKNKEGITIAGDRNVEINQAEYDRLTEVDKNGLRIVKHTLSNLYHECLHLRLKANWHFGDPPAHGCIGDTMNSIPEYEWEEFAKEW